MKPEDKEWLHANLQKRCEKAVAMETTEEGKQSYLAFFAKYNDLQVFITYPSDAQKEKSA